MSMANYWTIQLKKLIEITAWLAHLAYPDLALDKFSGTDSGQNAENFVVYREENQFCFWRRSGRRSAFGYLNLPAEHFYLPKSV